MGFLRAVLTFRHQTIYDPVSKSTLPLLPYPPNMADNPPPYLGELLSQKEAIGIAVGEINPITRVPFHSAEEVMDVEETSSCCYDF